MSGGGSSTGNALSDLGMLGSAASLGAAPFTGGTSLAAMPMIAGGAGGLMSMGGGFLNNAADAQMQSQQVADNQQDNLNNVSAQAAQNASQSVVNPMQYAMQHPVMAGTQGMHSGLSGIGQY